MSEKNVLLSGTVSKSIEKNLITNHRKSFIFEIKIKRKDDVYDYIPCICEKDKYIELYDGMHIALKGLLNSERVNGHLYTYVYVREFTEYIGDFDSVDLLGVVIWKKPLRITPLGKVVTDLMISINKKHTYDNIPVLIWNRNAERADKNVKNGDLIHIVGRLQSRQYTKKNEDETVETHTIREVSAQKIYVEKEGFINEKN